MTNSPVFVKIEDYQKVLDGVDVIKKQMASVRKTIDQIEKLRDQEEEELKLWTNNISEVEKEISFIDKTLFEPED